MASSPDSTGRLNTWYRNRIADPTTDDEVRGYWIYALGVIAGFLGILIFIQGPPASLTREIGIILASLALVALLVGPIVRLPLATRATSIAYLGAVISIIAIVWFVTAFPAQWDPASGQPTIMSLYALGLFIMALGGIFIPLIAGTSSHRETLSRLETELDELRAMLTDTKADEADLATIVNELHRLLADSLGDEINLQSAVEDLKTALTDTQADEADLAAQLRAIRTSRARFELYADQGGEHRWRLRHRNGNIIADSSEGYTTLANAQNGLESVRRNAHGASVRLFEDEEALPAAGTEFEPAVERTSRASFELYDGADGNTHWRLTHQNGNILADGSEGYESRGGARQAIDNLREYVGPADYVRIDPTAFEVYRDRAGEFRWRLVHRNGNILADSSEGYAQASSARRAIGRIQENLDNMETEVYEDSSGEYRWRLVSGNNRVMADSGEGYSDRSGADDAVDRLRRRAPDADLLEIGRAAFEIYEDKGGEFRWRLRHRNGQILADSGEGYSDRTGASDGIESVKRNAPAAEITE